ncbi:hypothetical protein AB4Z48_04535 [Cupriavidus sp. 2TAF22]|uniref:hypothetical protein n=1 Tax=unclassified Cupriavidus TaxID=2640874 RepID=UPI003F91B3FB
MSRQIKHKAELRAMIRAEQLKYPECAGTCFGDVAWHAPDTNGCNWTVSTMEGANSKACLEKIQAFTNSLQQNYNVPDEGK